MAKREMREKAVGLLLGRIEADQKVKRAAEKAQQLAGFADATLPSVPKLGCGDSGNPLDSLLERCTLRPLLRADVEACDLDMDRWVAEAIFMGYPPSHERHIWHSEYAKAREEQLWSAPGVVDYQAERAARDGSKL